MVDSTSCKICHSDARIVGSVPFTKNCLGVSITDSQLPDINYFRCIECGFLFSPFFDQWDTDQFRAEIYNENYLIVDPDAKSKRAKANAQLISGTFIKIDQPLNLLDYGGGNGMFASQLAGHPSLIPDSFDPYQSENTQKPDGKFEVITCFEVFEHVVDPDKLIADIVSLMANDSILIFSTLVQPPDLHPDELSWWYIAPRNGHISLFSRTALSKLLNKYGLKFVSFNDNLHAAFRRRPQFAAHFIPDQFA